MNLLCVLDRLDTTLNWKVTEPMNEVCVTRKSAKIRSVKNWFAKREVSPGSVNQSFKVDTHLIAGYGDGESCTR